MAHCPKTEVRNGCRKHTHYQTAIRTGNRLCRTFSGTHTPAKMSYLHLAQMFKQDRHRHTRACQPPCLKFADHRQSSLPLYPSTAYTGATPLPVLLLAMEYFKRILHELSHFMPGRCRIYCVGNAWWRLGLEESHETGGLSQQVSGLSARPR